MTNAELVIDFNQKILGIAQGLTMVSPDPDTMTLTIEQLEEEIRELLVAYSEKDFIGSIDALIDLIYFAYGALYKHGLDAERINTCFAAVNNANMTKKKGVKEERRVTDSDDHPADAIKPDGWVPPEQRIREILSAYEPMEFDK